MKTLIAILSFIFSMIFMMALWAVAIAAACWISDIAAEIISQFGERPGIKILAQWAVLIATVSGLILLVIGG